MTGITQSLRGKTLFITGATGFLGQPLVEKILWSAPDVRRLYLLIRSRRMLGGQVLSAGDRLHKELFRSSVFDRIFRHYGADAEKFMASKVIAVEGDIAAEKLGLSDVDAARIRRETDIVINGAAVVSFDAPLNEALELNTLSAARATRFAASCPGALLVHISTAYVSGANREVAPEELYHTAPPGETEEYPEGSFTDVQKDIARARDIIQAVMEEAGGEALSRRLTELLLHRFRKSRRGGKKARRREKIENLRRKWIANRMTEEGMAWARRRGWNDTYTYTKAMGEQAVVRHRGQMPTAIIRPSIIESSLEEPNPGWLDGLRMADPLIVAIGKGRLRELPMDPGVVIDLVPADMVVNAVLACIPRLREGGGLHIYQVATGDANPTTLGEVYELVHEYFVRNPMLDKTGRPIRIRRLKFPRRQSFRWRHKLRALPLETAERTLDRLPAISGMDKIRRRISAARAAYNKLYYYGEIYEPYLNLNSRFKIDNTRALYASLSAEEQKLFNFDVSRLSWRHYIQNVHIPGVKKHILKMEGAGTLEVDEPDTGAGRPATITDLIRNSARRNPHKPALQIKKRGRWQRYTYSEILHHTDLIARRLVAMGLEKGNRVILCSENHPGWGIAYLGASGAGLVVVPLDAQTWHREIWSIAEFTEARALLLSSFVLNRLEGEELRENEYSDEPCRLLNVDELCAPFELAQYPRSCAPCDGDPAGVEPPCLKGDDPASIIFTTGTAVDPRGAIHTHRNFINVLFGVNHHLPVAESDQLLSLLPLYHTLEFTCGFLAPLHGGATVTYLHSLKPRVILETMRETGTTCLLGVPTLYKLIKDDVDRRILKAGQSTLKSNVVEKSHQLSKTVGRRLGKNIGKRLFGRVHEEFGSQVRLLVSGGSALGEELYEHFWSLGFPIYEGYGLTETAPVLTVNPFQRSRKGSVGKPLPGVELRILRPDRNGVGEIAVRTPSLMLGYYKNPEATARSIQAGWFHTGDTGWVDADGYLYITGRTKDVIVTGAGKNIYPMDLEAIYGTASSAREVCVAGLENGLTEDVHGIFVVEAERMERDGEEGARKRIQQEIQHLARQLPGYQRLQQIHVWAESLPRKPSGEVDRPATLARLRVRLNQRKEKAGTAAAGSIEDEIIAEISRLAGVPEHEVLPGNHLHTDLGLDSLMTIELLLFLEHQLGVSVSDSTAERLETVRQLLEEVRSQRVPPGPPPKPRLPSAGSWAERSLLDRFLQKAFLYTLKLFYRSYLGLRVENSNRLPADRPYLIAANHASHLDGPAVILAVALSRGVEQACRVHVLGARDYFFDSGLKRWFFSTMLNVVPVERRETSLAGLRMAKSILRLGEPVLIFPEGTRSRSGQLQKFKPGIGLVAVESGAAVLPACVTGGHEAMPPGSRFPRPGRLRVKFGDWITPQRYQQGEGPRPDALYRNIAEDAYLEVLKLKGMTTSGR